MIFVAVILSVGLALSNVAFKQVILASTATQSQYAFYSADSAMECALEQDQTNDTFDYNTEAVGTVSNAFYCEGQAVSYTASAASNGTRTTTFSIPCTGGGSSAVVTIYKTPNAVLPTPKTDMYANGFNNCNTNDPQRLERGIRSSVQ